ncbi:21959_t:CDS:2, partial [Gigaspora margarita]
EQQHEVSQKTLDKSTENWKGADIKSRMNKKIGNQQDYNLFIKELLKNSEFTEFRNPKGAKVLELVNIANNIYAI